MKGDDWSPRQDDEEEFNSALHQRTEELYRIPDAPANHDGLIECPVLVFRDLVVFPRMVSPIFIVPGMNLFAIQEAQRNVQTVIALTQRDAEVDEPQPDDFLPIGVEMAVGRLLSMPDGNSSALVQGRRRVEIVEFTQKEPYFIVRARPINEPTDVDRQTDALMRTTRDLFERCVQLDRSLPDEAHLFSINISEPGWLADMVGTAISLPLKERAALLHAARSAGAAETGQHPAGSRTGPAPAGRRNPGTGSERSRPQPARVLPARADESHPNRAGRGRYLGSRYLRSARQGG